LTSTRAFWGLALAFAAVVGVRAAAGSLDLAALTRAPEFVYEQSVTVKAAPGAFHLSMFVPENGDAVTLAQEKFETADLHLDVERADGGRVLVIRGDAVSKPHTVRYSSRITTRPPGFALDESLTWPSTDDADSLLLAPTGLVQCDDPEVQEKAAAILGLDGTPPGSDAAAWRAALEAAGLTPLATVGRIFAYCHDTIEPAWFSGSTDAVTALRLGQSSCGGKSRLMLALARAIGIPGRIVGGVILGNRSPKRTSHVWVELRFGGDWVPFDPLNGHFGIQPDDYLRLYVGDRPLMRHSRGLAFDYSFRSPLEYAPGAWRPGGPLDAEVGGPGDVPLLRRGRFSIILLAPFALLLVVFARQVVGVQSIGVFLPVLLGFTVARTGWAAGAAQVLTAVVVGTMFRFLMARLQLLHVPRSAVLISLLVMVFLVLSVLSERLGFRGSGDVILPMAALALTIERFAFVAMDTGTRDALRLLGQTLLLSAGSGLVLTVPLYKALIVAVPEILLLVIGMVIVVGNYRGLRLTERWRFRHVEPHAGAGT